jgi:hypothetical protein
VDLLAEHVVRRGVVGQGSGDRFARLGDFSHCPVQRGRHERLARREVAVEGHPTHAGGTGDVGHRRLWLLAEARDGGIEDGGDVALGVGAAADVAGIDRGHGRHPRGDNSNT